MKKTISCNISGIIFNLEEDAYYVLNEYLDKLKLYLKNTEGGEEIYNDIELRIAELFSEGLHSGKQVVTDSDVADVVAKLGDPKDYVDQDEDETSEGSFDYEQGSSKKVFMRDVDQGIIGGVCAGLSSYFGLDLTLVRALFIIFLLVPGFGGILYVILWIITPAAKSTADKLKMRGEAINIDSLKNEMKNAAQKVEKYSQKKWNAKRTEDIKSKTNRVGRILGSILGFFMMAGGVFGILFFLVVTLTEVGLFTTQDGEQIISLYEFSDVLFSSSVQSFMGWTGLLGTVIIPLLFIITLGVTLFLHLRTPWLKYILTFFMIIWFSALALLTISGVQLGREFTHEAESEVELAKITGSELVVEVPAVYENHSNIMANVEVNDRAVGTFLELEDKNIKSGLVRLEVRPSKDSLFHVISEKSSSGITHQKALKLISHIDHKVEVEENKVVVSPFYLFPREDKLRGQFVKITILVPEGGEIEWKGNRKQLDLNLELD